MGSETLDGKHLYIRHCLKINSIKDKLIIYIWGRLTPPIKLNQSRISLRKFKRNIRDGGSMKDEITVTIKDSEGKTFSRDWRITADKRDAIRWTMGSADLPFYVEIDKIVEITVS